MGRKRDFRESSRFATKEPATSRVSFSLVGLPGAGLRLLYLAASQASGANPDALRRAIDDCTHPLQVRFPGSVRDVMGMTDAASCHGSLATDCTLLGHVVDLLDISEEGAYGSRNVGEIQ